MNISSKHIYTLGFLLFTLNFVYGQNSFVSVPSADAASIIKNGDIPVNYNNGTSQISYPIFGIKDYDLSLATSLLYQTGGIRVSEISSSIGSGWTYQYGGNITRIVRGIPDDLKPENNGDPVGCFWFLDDPAEYNNYPVKDKTPDLYFYNILGYSGSFSYENNEVLQKYQSDVIILRHGDDYTKLKYWEIILPTGVKCYFGFYDGNNAIDYSISQEINDNNEGPTIFSTWNIVKIVSPQNNEINFNYELDEYTEYSLPELKIPIESPCDINFSYNADKTIVNNYISSYRLTKITSPHYKINLSYGDARQDLFGLSLFVQPAPSLSIIRIEEKKGSTWTCLKEYLLDQFYQEAVIDGFNDTTAWLYNVDPEDYPDRRRLFLSGVTEHSCTEDINYETTFEYWGLDSLTRRLSNAQDYWGFANGKSANKSLVPRPRFAGSCFENVDCALSDWPYFGDKDSNHRYAMAGSLKSISYPNGSSLVIGLEGNEVRSKGYVNSDELFDSITICSITGGDCVSCENELEHENIIEFENIEYSDLSLANLDLEAIVDNCNNSGGKIQIRTKLSSENSYGSNSIVFETTLDPIYNMGTSHYEDYFHKLFTAFNFQSDFNWEYGNTYDLQIYFDDGMTATAKLSIDYFEPNIFNEEVGGLRIKSLASNDLVKKYEYISEEDLIETEEYDIVKFDLCDKGCGETAPGGPENNCNGHRVEYAFNVNIPCEGNLSLIMNYEQLEGEDCFSDYMLISFAWQESFPSSGLWDSITFTDDLLATGTTFSHNDLVTHGLTPGKNYNFRFRFANGQYGEAHARLHFTPNEIDYEPTGDYISSGELIMPPFELCYTGYRPEGLKYKNKCSSGYIYILSSSPQSQFQSSSGGIILYKNVNEKIYVSDEYYGKNKYYYNSDHGNGYEPVENKYSTIHPLIASYPPPTEFIHSPLYGLLEKSETYDSEDNLEISSETNYFTKEQIVFTSFEDIWKDCEDHVKHMFTQYRSPAFTVLPIESSKKELGISSISKIKYRSDLNHLNPIRTVSYVEGHQDSIITSMVYAEEAGNDLLFNHHMTSIPVETSINGGYGGGNKVDFEEIGGKILPFKYYRQLDNGDWRPTKILSDFTDDGFPQSVWNISTGSTTSYTWSDGLLTESTFGDRTNLYTYDPSRFLQSSEDYQDITTEYTYDPFFRLASKTTNNGKQETLYNYTISSHENKINSITSFPSDPYDLPTWESDQMIDVKGRSSFLIKRNYTYGGHDYTTGSKYGAFGEVLESCDPNKGGCDQFEYSLSPLRRLKKMVPAGSGVPILYTISSNDDVISIGDSINYPVHTLVKTSIIDENGIETDEYVNMRGQKVMVCRDPGGLNLKTYSRFNKRGSIWEVYPPGSSGENDEVNFIYSYNNDGSLHVKKIPDEGEYEYGYNSREVVGSILKPNGYETTFTYDNSYPDFLTNVKENGNDVKVIEPENLVKGWIGSVTVKLDNNSTLTTTYDSRDELGRVLDETRHYIDGVSEYTYAYDNADNLRDLERIHTTPDPKQDVTYSYSYYMPKGVRTDEVFLKLGSGLKPMALSQFEYNDNDWMTSDKVGDGLHTIIYQYHPRGWLQEINSVDPPPPGPKEDCDEIEDENPNIYSHCEIDGKQILIRISYDCNALSSGDTTVVEVSTQNGSSSQNSSILMNGALGPGAILPDSFEIIIGIDELGSINSILESVIGKCMHEETGSIKGPFDLNSLINQILQQMNEEGESLFGIKLHYYDGNGVLEAPGQNNGNIAWMDWQVAGENYQSLGFQYDHVNRLTQSKYEGKYTKCKKTPADYDETFGYDVRGNITSLTRNGFIGINNSGVPLYDEIDHLSYAYTGANQLHSVSESADEDHGYLGSASTYTYEDGKLVSETGAKAVSVEYNFLNQPTLIKMSGKKVVRNIWDADGVLQKQILYDENEDELNIRLFHDGIEYVDGKIEAINHDEGRYVFERENDGSIKRTYHEFMIADHLGNIRVRFADLNGDRKINVFDQGPGQEKEVLGSFHYYPFGLKMEGIFHPQISIQCKNQYNGIEHIGHKGLNVDLATWRTLDPAIGRWWQVDPKAESLYGMSPFNSMGNNPICLSDPNGDFLWVPIIMGAAIGGFFGGKASVMSGQNFFGGFLKGALVGSIGGLIGSGFASLGAVLSIQGILPGVGYGGLTGALSGGISGGLGAELSGGNFGDGFKGGAISGALMGAVMGGIEGGSNAAANNRNLLTGGEKGTVYTSPVSNNYGNVSGECTYRCLEEISDSYGLSKYDYKYWYALNGGKSGSSPGSIGGVSPSGLNSFVNSSGVLQSTEIYYNPFLNKGGDVSGIINSFKNNQRVLMGFNSSGTTGHAVLVNRLKIWPSGKFVMKFAETSQVHIAPFRVSDLYNDFSNGAPRFWSIYR